MPKSLLASLGDNAVGDDAHTPASYIATLLGHAAPDVGRRLEEIGDFVIDESNLVGMRARQLRDPGVPSGRSSTSTMSYRARLAIPAYRCACIESAGSTSFARA